MKPVWAGSTVQPAVPKSVARATPVPVAVPAKAEEQLAVVPPLLPEQLQFQPELLSTTPGVPAVQRLALSGAKRLGGGLAQTPCTTGATATMADRGAAQPASSLNELLDDVPTTEAPTHALTEKLLDVDCPPEESKLFACILKLALLAAAAQTCAAVLARNKMPALCKECQFMFFANQGQVGPVVPVEPTGPVTPVSPEGPVGPAAPVLPVGPIGPVHPVPPVGPMGPV